MDSVYDLWANEDIRLFVKALAIILGSWIFTYLINLVLLRVVFARRDGKVLESKRVITLAALLRSLVKYVVFFVAFVMVLGIYNVPTASLLASAGVAGLAIGFGAQSLIKDIISGFFIIFEDQYTVGEHIRTANLEGVVEEIGLRATRLKDFNGSLHFIPNGLIDVVTNFSRGKIRAMADVGIAYEEDVDKALTVISEACAKLAQEMDSIVEGPTVLGVTKLAEYEVSIRVVAFAKPGEQWAVERAILKKIKEHLDKAGIEIPYPRRVMLSHPGLSEENIRRESDAGSV